MTAPPVVPVLWLQVFCLANLRIIRLQAAIYLARQAVARLKEGGVQ